MQTISRYGLLAIFVSLITGGCGVGHSPVSAAANAGWGNYGGDAGGTHYSVLTQITPANVKDLKVVWTYRTGDTGAGFPGDEWKSHMAFETTPIFYDGMLYFTTPSTNVVAVNAVTGKLLWRVNTHVEKLWYSDAVSRGVSLWVDDGTPADAVCHARIFAPTLDGRLLALDAATGKLCPGFADHGVLSLTAEMHLKHHNNQNATIENRNYLVTSPPAILHGKLIIGSSIGDNRSTTEESGEVRAFDTRTGKLLELGPHSAGPHQSGVPGMESQGSRQRRCRQCVVAHLRGYPTQSGVSAHHLGGPRHVRRRAARR